MCADHRRRWSRCPAASGSCTGWRALAPSLAARSAHPGSGPARSPRRVRRPGRWSARRRRPSPPGCPRRGTAPTGWHGGDRRPMPGPTAAGTVGVRLVGSPPRARSPRAAVPRPGARPEAGRPGSRRGRTTRGRDTAGEVAKRLRLVALDLPPALGRRSEDEVEVQDRGVDALVRPDRRRTRVLEGGEPETVVVPHQARLMVGPPRRAVDPVRLVRVHPPSAEQVGRREAVLEQSRQPLEQLGAGDLVTIEEEEPVAGGDIGHPAPELVRPEIRVGDDTVRHAPYQRSRSRRPAHRRRPRPRRRWHGSEPARPPPKGRGGGCSRRPTTRVGRADGVLGRSRKRTSGGVHPPCRSPSLGAVTTDVPRSRSMLIPGEPKRG